MYAYANGSPVTLADCQGTKPVRLDKRTCRELADRIKEDEYESRSGDNRCGNFKGPRGRVPQAYKVIAEIRVPNPILRPTPPRSVLSWRLDEQAAVRAIGLGVGGSLLIYAFIRLGSYRLVR